MGAYGWLLNLGFAGGSSTVSHSDSTWTLSNVDPERAVDMSAPPLEEDLAHTLGTVIYDWRTAAWDGSNYTISGTYTELRTFDCLSATLNQLMRVLSTLIEDNPGTLFTAEGFTVTNPEYDFVYDPTITDGAEIARVLASLLSARGVGPLLVGSVEATRLEYGAVAVERR